MHIRISVPDEQHALAVADLHRWFRQDAEVRRHAEIRRRPLPRPGAMGAFEVVDMVVGHGFTALSLALSYAAWRAARPAAPPVTVTVDGVSVTVRDASEASVQRIVSALRAAETSAAPPQSGAHDGARSPGASPRRG